MRNIQIKMIDYNISGIKNEYLTLKYEKSINEKMMYYDYVFPIDEIYKYVDAINDIDCEWIVNYIKTHDNSEPIVSGDIFQFSSFDDCTVNICKVLKKENNPGVNYLSIGKLLLKDGKSRNDGAYIKYGENHLKTAQAFDLVWNCYNSYYLTCIGSVFDTLSKENQEKLLIRLLLRNKLVRKIIKITIQSPLDMRQFCYMLSDTTYIRRRSNLKKIFSVLAECKEYSFNEILNNIVW